MGQFLENVFITHLVRQSWYDLEKLLISIDQRQKLDNRITHFAEYEKQNLCFQCDDYCWAS